MTQSSTIADPAESPERSDATIVMAATASGATADHREADQDAATDLSSPFAAQPPRRHSELLTAWLLLLLDGGATHCYELHRALERHRLNIDVSAVYRMLRRLERERCVESGWTGSARGPRRRSYRLTAKGRRRLEEIAALLNDLHDTFARVRVHTGTPPPANPTVVQPKEER